MDLFTSLHDMQALAHHEYQLLHILHDHITHQQTKLSTLIEKYERLLHASPQDQPLEQYISHPVNAFSLIRRLAREWPIVLHFMIEQPYIPAELIELPGEEELRSAYRGLARLQEVYKIRTQELAQGDLDGIPSKHKMSAIDCYEMGKHWYERTDYTLAQSWFNQALDKISEGDSTVQRELVFSHLYLAVAFSGCEVTFNMAATNNLLHHTIVSHPNLKLSSDLSVDFSQVLAKNCSWVLHNRNKAIEENFFKGSELDIVYSELCQGLGETPSSFLKCHYVHHNNPRLLVAPFKAEELHLDPPILLFHDVVSDQEMEDMKNSFSSVMTECETLHSDNQPYRSSYRTCHVGWVEDSWSKTSAQLTRRMADMSNLNLETSEMNQVASYGLGGEFQLHHDALRNVSLSAEYPVGDRIATMMLYLSDVPSGGRTVFSSIKVSIAPQKGSAVFWFNLDSHGRLLPAMLHGGCPVLRGSKWVLNKWIREAGQDFEKTCPSNGNFPEKQFYLNSKNV